MSGTTLANRRRVKMCLAPSVELDQLEASFTGRLVEDMVAYDYLYSTRSTPPLLRKIATTIGDYFDNGILADYKKALKNRHPLEVNREVLDSKREIKIPDISTWHGEYRFRILGLSILEKYGNRNEIYEIKPHNDRGRKKGIEKLDDINKNNRDLGLIPSRLRQEGYVRGTWYPHGRSVRKIRFTKEVLLMRALDTKLRRWSAIMAREGLTMLVHDFYIELTRTQPGLLQYRICFEFEVDSNASEEFVNVLTVKLMRLLYDHIMVGLPPEKIKQELAVLQSMRVTSDEDSTSNPFPVRPGPSPQVSLLDQSLEKEEKFETQPIELVDEVKPLYQQLRAALYTRQRAMPGDIFIVVCDDTYFRQEVEENRKQIFAQRVQLLRSIYGPAGLRDIPSGIAISRTAMITSAEAIRAVGSEARRFQADPMKWVSDHSTEIKIAVAAVVVLTALTIVLIASSGTSAPVVIPLAEATLAEAAIAGEAALTTGVAASGSAGVLAGEGAALAIGSTTSRVGLAVAMDTAGLTESQLVALRFGLAMRQAQATTALGTRLAAQSAVADELLLSSTSLGTLGRSAPVMNSMLLASIADQPGDGQRRALQDCLSSQALTHWRNEITSMVPATVALSAHHLVARGQASQNASSVTLGIGHLYLARARSLKELDRLPPLESAFDWRKVTDDLAASGRATPVPERLRYLGVIRCRA